MVGKIVLSILTILFLWLGCTILIGGDWGSILMIAVVIGSIWFYKTRTPETKKLMAGSVRPMHRAISIFLMCPPAD